jgi:hypothetical protein
VTSEWWIGKDLVGSVRGVILRYYYGIRMEGLKKTAKNFNQDPFSGSHVALFEKHRSVPWSTIFLFSFRFCFYYECSVKHLCYCRAWKSFYFLIIMYGPHTSILPRFHQMALRLLRLATSLSDTISFLCKWYWRTLLSNSSLFSLYFTFKMPSNIHKWVEMTQKVIARDMGLILT